MLGRLAPILMLLMATGCFGGSAAAPGSSSATTPGTGLVTVSPQMVVGYWAGRPVRTRAAVGTPCPALGACQVVRVRGDRPAEWALRVHRTLSCGPARGSYPDPGRACRALVQYISLTKQGSSCFCPALLLPGGHVIGDLRGRHVDVHVDFCDACGHGRAAADDVRILTPGQGF